MKKLFNQASTSLPLVAAKEGVALGKAWLKHGVLGIPKNIFVKQLSRHGLAKTDHLANIKKVTGDGLLQFINEIGPVYGKAAQIALMKLSKEQRDIVMEFGLDRLLGQWPALDFAEIASILDKEIPQWREELEVDPVPLGVASMAQVHQCTDQQGQHWVIKVLKPNSCKRLLETAKLIDLAISQIPFSENNRQLKNLIRDVKELTRGLREEISLTKEKETILTIKEKLAKKRQKVLEIPRVLDHLCTDRVLTIEKFDGVILSDVVTGKVSLTEAQRKKLARSLLSELLIQVFELGLFHGDPHAGNLILLPNGNIGLFDWGLAGELSEKDRKHVAAVLKAVMIIDRERLVDALADLAQDSISDQEVSREQIDKEITRFIERMKKKLEDGQKPSFVEMIEGCLKVSNKLGVDLPSGLLMMVKSLVTIEGLARGVDPEVPLKRIASPVLFRAAQPSVGELLSMAKKFPKIAKKILS